MLMLEEILPWISYARRLDESGQRLDLHGTRQRVVNVQIIDLQRIFAVFEVVSHALRLHKAIDATRHRINLLLGGLQSSVQGGDQGIAAR